MPYTTEKDKPTKCSKFSDLSNWYKKVFTSFVLFCFFRFFFDSFLILLCFTLICFCFVLFVVYTLIVQCLFSHIAFIYTKRTSTFRKFRLLQ